MPNSTTDPITKSQFKLGLDCIHKLQHARNKLPQRSRDDDLLRLLAEGGAAVEALVRATEPGLLIGGFGEDAVAQSRAALLRAAQAASAGRATTLYEVTICDEGFLARLDLVRIRPDGIDLVEIKSKSVDATGGQVDDGEFFKASGDIHGEWAAYVRDLAFQHALLRRWFAAQLDELATASEYRITPKLLLTNKAGTATMATVLDRRNYQPTYRPTPHGVRAEVEHIGNGADRSLLVEVDMSRAVQAMEADAQSRTHHFEGLGIQACMAEMRRIVDSDTWPEATASLTPACKHCEFRVKDDVESGFLRCWGVDVGSMPHHVLTLSHITKEQCEQAIESRQRGAKVTDVDAASIANRQRMQYESLRRNQPIVAQRFASAPSRALKIANVTGPVHFLDFETFAHPIPARVGGHPFEVVPFQFEGHRLPSPNAPLSERVQLDGFLEIADPDPRRAFVDALRQQLGSEGPIFHWHSYERTVLNAIVRSLGHDRLPGDDERRAFLATLVGPNGEGDGRLVDLLVIAQSAFYHPDMHGSYSIKRVLPIAWAEPSIRRHFAPGHGTIGDPTTYTGATDPYAELPPPPADLLQALGGVDAVQALATADDEESRGSAIRNGGMAMLAYQFARMLGAPRDPAVTTQLRQYCRLDSAAMVMMYALMRDLVPSWSQYGDSEARRDRRSPRPTGQ